MRRSNGCHPAYVGRAGPVGSEDWRASARRVEVRALLESSPQLVGDPDREERA